MGLIRRTLTLLAAVLVSVPVVVAPVVAASGMLPSWACVPGAVAAHGEAVGSTPAAAGRGGQFREPDLG